MCSTMAANSVCLPSDTLFFYTALPPAANTPCVMPSSPIFQLPSEMKVNWSTSANNQPKLDTSKHFHIFVGDLSPDIETHQLRDAFSPFGQISDCKIIRDPQTLKSKGYGFVSFIKKEDAESAINGMNGQWIGSRAIRTNWASRKPPTPASKENTKPLNYEEVYGQSSPTNCTVYCGGIANGLTEEVIQKTFSTFGAIQEIRVFKDKGYAFVRFATKDVATQAIVSVHGTDINGQTVKCSWGKESNDPTSPTSPSQANSPSAVQQFTGQPYSQASPFYSQMGGYYYPQGYQPVQQTATGFMQPYMQHATYAAGYQAGGVNSVPVQWPGVQMNPAAAAAAGQQQFSTQQQNVMTAYPIQQNTPAAAAFQQAQ